MRVTMTVNGEQATADDVWEGESLLFVLRERLALPGSKNACEQGECGSCTVLLDDMPVCACLVAAGQAADREVVTVEGLAGRQIPVAADGLHPVQQAFIDAGAVQCGFCTPGLIMQTHWFLQQSLLRQADGAPADADIREALAGNLCRCTGYEKILERRPAGRRAHGRRRPMTPAVVIENCAIATMDGRTDEESGTEHRSGHIMTADGRIIAVGAGPARDVPVGARRVDGTGCLATPGLINTHHHLYQWLTQGRAQQSVLFDWLTELVPGLGQDRRRAGARRGHGGPGLAGPVRVHDQHRSPLHLPAGRR